MSQRCYCQRCNINIRTIAVTALCSFSLSQRCAHRCLTAVGFLLCSMSQSGKKPKKNEKRKVHLMSQWTTGTSRTIENVDWKSCQTKYGAISNLCNCIEQYPSSEDWIQFWCLIGLKISGIDRPPQLNEALKLNLNRRIVIAFMVDITHPDLKFLEGLNIV